MANPRYRRLSATLRPDTASETPKRYRVRPAVIGMAVLASVVAGCLSGVAIAAVNGTGTAPPPAQAGGAAAGVSERQLNEGAPVAQELPVPEVPNARPVQACDLPEVADAIDAGDASGVIEAFGGADALRAAIAEGSACVSVDDPVWPWVVVNKARPLDPPEYAPAVVLPSTTTVLSNAHLASVAADALDEMTAAAGAEGAGDMALFSGFRSYSTQVSTFNAQVGNLGQDDAEHLSARPGFSEHQLGLAADVVACSVGTCGDMYGFDGTAQSNWVDENSWRFGYIVRYEPDQTGITGYHPEAWHLRYIGPELATAYHEGGYRTLEEFFGLDAAPDYLE